MAGHFLYQVRFSASTSTRSLRWWMSLPSGSCPNAEGFFGVLTVFAPRVDGLSPRVGIWIPLPLSLVLPVVL